MKKFLLQALALSVVIFSFTACAAVNGINNMYNKDLVSTGLFETGAEARVKAEGLKMGETSCPAGLKDAGFDTTVKNVNNLPGAKGQKYILGTDTPQLKVDKPEDIDKYAEVFSRYIVYEYPIKDVKSDRDLIYLNKQNTLKTGTDVTYYIVCREGFVHSHGLAGVENINQPSINKQFGGNVGQGIWDAIKGVTGKVGF